MVPSPSLCTQKNPVRPSMKLASNEFKGASVGADIAWIADAVTTNGDACSVGLGFLGTNKTHHLGVDDFFASVRRDVIKIDDVESVSSIDTFASAVGTNTNTLTEATQFIGVGFIPDGREPRMIAELPIFEELACVHIKDR